MGKFLIAGLGNEGAEYIHTRHNIGFEIADALAGEAGVTFFSDRLASHASFRLKGKSIHLIKPSTFMNQSGRAIQYWLSKFQIPQQNLLVLVDDIALPFGIIRIRSKGSSGGHNGLKSVEEHLNSREYARLRFGVEGNFARGRQVDYVLGKWNEQEKKQLPEKIKTAVEAVKSFVLAGMDITMNQYNTKPAAK
jgi:PTH1 family peptidyl-tRNA hydrolase